MKCPKESHPCKQTAQADQFLVFPAEDEIEIADDLQRAGQQRENYLKFNHLDIVLPLQVVDVDAVGLDIHEDVLVDLLYLGRVEVRVKTTASL